MLKSSSLILLLIVGLSGCLQTQTKTGLARPDFSTAHVASGSVAPVKTQTRGCCCEMCKDDEKAPTKAPEPKKKKIVGELPEYQDEDTGEGPI